MQAEGQRPSKNTSRATPKTSSSLSSKNNHSTKAGYIKKKRTNRVIYIFFLIGFPLYYLLLSTFRFLLFGVTKARTISLPKLKLSFPYRPKSTRPLDIYTTRFLKKTRRRKPFRFKLALSLFPLNQTLLLLKKFSFPSKKLSLKLPKPALKKALPLRFPHLPRFSVFLILFLFSLGSLIGFFYFWVLVGLPSPKQLTSKRPNLTTLILDRNGQVLYRLYTDENRQLIKLSDLPAFIPQAIVAIEDKNFYNHPGISLQGIFRALTRNFDSSTTSLQGGSTITQQLVKTVLLSREKTLRRKLKEVVLALETEFIYTKSEILELYLNQVNFGGTAYGIQSAAQQYFGVDAKDLNLAQATLLAGLPQSPTRYSPFGPYPGLALERQKQVLASLLQSQQITQEQYNQAISTPLRFNSPKPSILAPHFVMYVRDYLVKNYDESLVNHGGLIVTTTLDLNVQQLAQAALNSELSRLRSLNVTNAAALVTDPRSGEILAMVGSRDYFDTANDGQVNLTTSLRQPGSSVKPFNYALAFEKGLSPSQTIDDSPITFATPGSPPWSPKNYDGRYHGTVTLRTALASSYNIPAVKLLARDGVTDFANLATSLGITTWGDPSRFGLSMTLGSNEVKMVDMATAYSAFPNLGTPIPLTPILKLVDHNNKLLPPPPCSPSPAVPAGPITAQAADDTDCFGHHSVISPKTAYIINDILSDPLARAPAFGTNSVLNIPGKTVAVKTGTSNELRDNWTFGYTSNLLVSVWVGNNDNTPMSRVASGITGASPIWSKIMTTLLNDQANTPFDLPDTLTRVNICGLTKTLTCASCPNPYPEVFTKGTEPKTSCNEQQISKLLEEKQKQQALQAANNQILEGASTSR